MEAVVPSLLDGIPSDVEELQLAYGADLISEAGRCLRLSQLVIVSAQTLFHRFYAVTSLQAHSHLWSASAALLVATKAEEQGRRIRDIANVVHYCFCAREKIGTLDAEGRPTPLEYYGEPGYEWKSTIVTAERHMLKELGFHVLTDSPHKFVLVFMNTLRDKAGFADWSDKRASSLRDVLRAAWKYANDAHRGRAPVLEKPEALACACISLAAQNCEEELPAGWEVVFGSDDVSCRRICAAIKRLCSLGPTAGRFVDLAKYGVVDMCKGVSPS